MTYIHRVALATKDYKVGKHDSIQDEPANNEATNANQVQEIHDLPRSSRICYSNRDGESAILNFDGTLSTHKAILASIARDQISWISSLWSKAFAEPFFILPSAPMSKIYAEKSTCAKTN